MIGIIDGDILVYRACHKALKEGLQVTEVFDQLYEDLQDQMACESYSLHISGGGNFRKDLKQGFTKYKGKRKEKPGNYKFLRDYILKNYDTITVANYEADDTASIEGTSYLRAEKLFMVATVDKDWKLIGGLFYNTQYKTLSAISNEEAMQYFHMQLITGDSVDNIPGVYGMGIKKAERLLKGKSLPEQFESIIRAYKKHYPENWEERLTTMGIMLYLVKDYDDPRWSINWWKEYLNENKQSQDTVEQQVPELI